LKKKVIKLQINTEFKLIGIVSRLSAYKLSWLFNKEINTEFKQTHDLVLKSPGKDKVFVVFESDTNKDVTYRLIENKNDSGTLIRQLSNVDFLLKIDGGFSDKNIEHLIKKMRSIDDIIASLSIDILTLKQKEISLLN